MAKLPYMELYVDDYHSATAHLDEREDGIYFRLLRICWQTPGCSIPDDNIWLERKMRMKGKHEDIRAILVEFFTLKNGRWFQKKQMQIFCKTKSKILERKKAGKKGGIAKALKYKDKTPSNTKDLLKQNPSKPLASRTRTISKEKKEYKESLKALFESEFWEPSIRKDCSRTLAEKKFISACSVAKPEVILASWKAHLKSWKGKDVQYIPLPTTWLHQERWTAEVLVIQSDFDRQLEAL